ncbi:MAG TPA: hypothetical protein VLT33_16310 [Labilithrix sp.]|nr:hypothetical protein [Labilithrix sp.]
MNTSPTFLAALVLALGASACAGNTLDGGSSQTDGGSPAAPAGDATIPAAPVAGTVNGKAFVPRTFDVQREGGRWFFTVRSYDVKCGTSTGSPLTGPQLTLVNIGDIATQVGTQAIAYGDGHGATFQTGVYEQGKGDPLTSPVTSGTLRFDTWSETPGETVTGGLRLTGDGSSVAGTFTATVCPPRG